MAHDDPNSNPFLTNGRTTREGQDNWGDWEKKKGYTPEPQKSYESYEDYLRRINR